MVHPLSSQKKSYVISMLQRGVGVREVSRNLHVGVQPIHRLRKKFVSTIELSHGGRPRKLTLAMERSCVLDMTRGKLNLLWRLQKMCKRHLGYKCVLK